MTQTVSTESPMELSPRERLIQIMKREQALFTRQTLSQKPGYRGGKKAFEYFIRQKIVKAVEAGCGDAEALLRTPKPVKSIYCDFKYYFDEYSYANCDLCVEKAIEDCGNNTLRKVKTDKADARKIARYGLDNWVELRQHTPMDTIRMQLKTLNRQQGLYSKTKTMMKNNLIALLDQTYPDVNALFDSPVREDGSQKWVDFATTFWHVDCVRAMSLTAFMERYRKWCKRHGYNFSQSRAIEIHMEAQDLIAMLPKDALTKTMIRQAIDALNAVSKSLEQLKAEMRTLAAQLPEYPVVMAMRGVGNSLGPQLMAEIGDVTRFAHRGSITAFAGVDPGADQSGTHEAKSNRTSKSGPPELRRALFLVMDCLLKTMPQNDPVYRFMDKKRAEGKPYLVYMTAGTNKFLRIYYGRIKEYLASLEGN